MRTDPLPSWNPGPAKLAIVDFVARISNEHGPDFVPVVERIATFDNDGTLWCEHPQPVQGFFLADRIRQLIADDPSLAKRQPFKAFVAHDISSLRALGKQGIAELTFATHAGMTSEQFDLIATAWLASAKHPEFSRLFTECTYRPQAELLIYLRSHGFKTYIVSGGGIDFIRCFSEKAYGIPREQVIGSSARTRFEIVDGRAVLTKYSELNSFDDRDAKPENIGLHIGRRPILSFGNSDGDLAMLRYTKLGYGARLALLLHHDDADREAAYDREFHISPLAEALDKAGEYGIVTVSMKNDWKEVFEDRVTYEARRRVTA